jgi:hypothetical protein
MVKRSVIFSHQRSTAPFIRFLMPLAFVPGNGLGELRLIPI